MQKEIFDESQKEVIDKLKKIDVNTLTPIEAMGTLFEMVNLLKK